MYWLLLPVAAVTLILGLRTPSMLVMTVWLIVTAVLLGLWVWLRFRDVFPDQNAAEIALTPMDAEALRQVRAQAEAERAQASLRGHAPAASYQVPHAGAGYPVSAATQPPFAAPDPFASRPAPQAPLPPSGNAPRPPLPSALSAGVPSSSIFSTAARQPYDDDDAQA